MTEKKYNKYTSISDRFPFIIVILILIFAVIFIFQFKARFPLLFFSGSNITVQDTTSASFPIFVASPTNEEVFNFINKNEYVPIEIKSKKIEVPVADARR